jgi:hypothetical protein
MRVTEQVTNATSACARCTELENFDNATNSCVCTPDCGYCGSDDGSFPLYYNRSGVACVDLGAVVDGSVNEATIIPQAGGVMPGPGYEGDPECSYGYSWRTSKRGGKYHASSSDIPAKSIALVDMSTQTFHCNVDLPEAPWKIFYVPRVPLEVPDVGPVQSTEDHEHGEDGASSDDAGSEAEDAEAEAENAETTENAEAENADLSSSSEDHIGHIMWRGIVVAQVLLAANIL